MTEGGSDMGTTKEQAAEEVAECILALYNKPDAAEAAVDRGLLKLDGHDRMFWTLVRTYLAQVRG